MITIRFRWDFTILRRALARKLDKRSYFVLAFLIPLIVRSIPELLSPVPVGFDTAIYLVQAKNLANSSSILPFFARILGLLHLAGVDLMVLMKVLPVLVFAATVFLACIYAYLRLRWSPRKILLLAVVMSFSAAMLRMSWDLHRQSIATLLLLAYLCIDPGRCLTRGKVVASFALIAFIALLHELVLVAATAINFYLALMSLRKKEFRNAPIFLTLALTPLACYEVAVYISYSRLASPYAMFENLLAEWGPGGYSNLVSHSVGLLVAVFWYALPLAPLGFFRDNYLMPWFLTMLAGYLSEILVPFSAVHLAERWMLYMAIPMMFYAANAISKLNSPGKYRTLTLTIALMIVSINGFSMLGIIQPFRLPSNLYIGLIPATMVFSTAKPEHVVRVIEFSKIINAISGENYCVVTHDPWFKYWVEYLTSAKVYSFSETNPEPVISKAIVDGCDEVYIIWFSGQVSDDMVLAEGDQLALYRLLR